jgi:hypothetical protein
VSDARVISDLQLRAYFAAVIGPTRAPYGQKQSFDYAAGDLKRLVQNTTRDRVLRVLVSRSDITGGVTTAASFTQNVDGTGSSDFSVSFLTTSSFPFVLFPGETLSLSCVGAAKIVLAQEPY